MLKYIFSSASSKVIFVRIHIYRSHESTHIVERFNKTLAQHLLHLFRIQYHKEMQTGKLIENALTFYKEKRSMYILNLNLNSIF